MKNRLLIGLCLVLVQSRETFGEGTNEVKRGTYPYMAFLYYPDETVVENGARFFRSAVLIKPEWLLSSSIDHSTSDGFPLKTLLARVGAVFIDAKVTLNEDEDEQEREIIQIVRPTLHNQDMWYFTDVTLLQTLLPFNMTSAVGLAPYSIKPRDNADQKCFILVYAMKYDNSTEDKELMQMSVELVVPANPDNCGAQFSKSSMTCTLDTEETKSSLQNPNFCQGNSGGPLICDNEVIGLQTYINSVCKPPHLYQLLSSWENLITCGTQKRCSQEYCSSTCTSTDKDPPTTEMSVSHTPETSSEPVVAVETSEGPQSVEGPNSVEQLHPVEGPHSVQEPHSVEEPHSVQEPHAVEEPLSVEVPQYSVEKSHSVEEAHSVEVPHSVEESHSVAETTTANNSRSTTQLSSSSYESSTSSMSTTTSYRPETSESSTTTKKRTKGTKSTSLRTAKKKTTAPTTVSVNSDASTESKTLRTLFHGEDKNSNASELKVHDMEASDEEEAGASARRANVEARVSSITHKTSAGTNMYLLKSLLVDIVVLALVI